MRLIIAEKAIAAKRIAGLIASKQPKPIKSGSITYFDVGDDTIVFPLRGHILNVDYPSSYNNWRAVNLRQLVTAPLNYDSSAHNIVNLLKKLAPKATHVTIATDFDTEGESIGREALRIILEKSPNVKIDRAKFSAITKEEVSDAFNNLTDLDYNLADAADSRREIDLLWGAVLTRFVSLASGRLGKQFLSVGRVQTPTLSLIVDREKERRAFKPKKYWTITSIFHKEKDFEGSHSTDKFWDDPTELYNSIKNEKIAVVINVKKSKKKLKPPTPFNTTDFLRAASSIGVSPSRAMSIAEELYQAGFISYPRTDNTHYPESIKVKEITKKFLEHPEFKKDAELVLAQKKIIPTKGRKKTTDHPPIHPVELASKSALGDKWKVYELVVRRFFATLLPECVMDTVHVDLEIKKEPFVSNGQTISIAGWKAVYPYSKSKENVLPQLSEGEEIAVNSITLSEKETQPPKLYSPAALIKLMEDLNLGTKATRPEIIKKLVVRGYLKGSKSYEPTEIGFALVAALEDYAGDITKPVMTAKLEGEMAEVEAGKRKKDVVVGDSRSMLGIVLNELILHNDDIGKSLKIASKNADIVGKCNKCGNDLRLITSMKTRKRFVGCTNYPKCTNSFPLPQKGSVSFTDKVCEHCGTPIVKIASGRRSYEMCLDMNCETKASWGKKK